MGLSYYSMGTTLSQSQEAPVASSRKGRPNHSEEFKRWLSAAACEPGISVSTLARKHGINANMLFTWRRRYRAQQRQEAAVLLPVTIEQPGSPPALKRHLMRALLYRKHFAARFAAWHELTEVAQNPSTAL